MSTETNPKGKGGRASASANNDADSTIPLLLATIGNPSISFKKMAAMDELGRTESSLEHKFRKWRQKGRDIAADNPDNAGTLGTTSAATTPKKPRVPAKKVDNGKGKGPAQQAHVGDEVEEMDDEEGLIKQEPDEMPGTDGKMSNTSTKGKATAIDGAKKRAASGAVEREGSEPAKKAKVTKKGIAKVVKKPNAKAYSGSEEEDSVGEDAEEVSTKARGKGNAKVATTKGNGKSAAKPTKAKKGKADVTAKAGHVPSREDMEVDMDGGDAPDDGMTDMQFDEAA